MDINMDILPAYHITENTIATNSVVTNYYVVDVYGNSLFTGSLEDCVNFIKSLNETNNEIIKENDFR